jgi:outer membrane lipopolysaccharide assembly protein LptE/RlpB
MNTIYKSIIWTVLFLGMLGSCGYYSFKGALPPHAKSIAIPIFDDRTSYPDAREYITNSVVDAFIVDNTLAVVDEEDADLVMRGTIQSITQRAAAVTAGEVTSEYKLIVRIKLVVEDKVLNKKMVDKSLEQFAFLDAGAGLDERNTAVQEAMDLLVDDIFNATLASW